MPFRNKQPLRRGNPRSAADANDNENYDNGKPSGPLRQSVQGLSYQQLVSRQRQLWQGQFNDSSNTIDVADDMKIIKRLSKTTSSTKLKQADPKRSSTTLHSMEDKLESKIDLDAAVSLLQELKMHASPEELVALHRALLPVKDETPTSPQLPWSADNAYSAAPPVRKRSVMPPGLATRSGVSEDVLRKPDNATSLPTPAATPVNTRLVPWLDPPGKPKSGNTSPARLGTPSEQPLYHAGAFQPGTLRITNGRASPDPSIISKQAMDGGDSNKDQRGCSLSSSQQEDQASEHSQLAESSQPHDSSQYVKPTGDPSKPPLTRPASFDIQSRRCHQTPLKLDSQLQLQRSSGQPSNSDSFNEMTRFQQRWSHRAMHLSQEYLQDCEITASPYEEKNGPHEVASRTSTICDGDGDGSGVDEVADECCNGSAQRGNDLSMLEEDCKSAGMPELVHAGLSTNDANQSSLPNQRRPSIVPKMDSGYCSDSPSTPINHESPLAYQQTIQGHLATEEGKQDSDNIATRNIGDSSPEQAQNFLHVPPSVENDMTLPLESSVKRSPLSLFKPRTRTSKRSSLAVLSVDSDHLSQDSPRIATVHHTIGETGYPIDRQQRKLHKPIPKSVEHKRAKTLENIGNSGILTSPIPPAEDSFKRSVESPAQQSRLTASHGQTEIHMVPRAGSIDEANGVATISTSTISTSNEEPRSRFSRLRGKSFALKRSKTATEVIADSFSPAPSPAPQSNAADHAPIPIPPAHRFTFRAQDNEHGSVDRETSRATEPTSFASVAQASSSPPCDQPPKSANSIPPRRSRHTRYYSMNSLHIQTAKDKLDPAAKTAASTTVEGLEHDESSRQDQNASPATPSHQMPLPPVAIGSNQSVEDRFPGWQGKPASRESSHSEPSRLSLPSQHPFVRSRFRDAVPSGIPELPAFPADIQSRVNKADQIVARKLKSSPLSSPTVSARASIDSDMRKQYTSKSTTYRTLQAGNAEDPREATPNASNSLAYNTGAAQCEEWRLDEAQRGKGSMELAQKLQSHSSSSPTHDAQHPGWPGWERQAILWRQRKEALRQACDETSRQQGAMPIDDNSTTAAPVAEASPTVFSRYITPLAAENVHNARNTIQESENRALKLARSYTNLIGENKENCVIEPGVSRADSGFSAATVVTMHSSGDRPAKLDVSRTSGANSTTSSTTVSTTSVSLFSWSGSRSSQSSQGSVCNRSRHKETKSGPLVPYRQADGAQSEHSRALGLTRGSCSTAEGKNESFGVSQRPEFKKKSSEGLIDRYGGGMGIGWDRAAGFGGSAGMRTPNTFEPENRKSIYMSEEFGLDLSDVPVFLRKEQSSNMR